jgi:hypothetical protein
MSIRGPVGAVLDADAIELVGGARERHLAINAGAYPLPFWLVIQPDYIVGRVDSLPFRWQGVAQSVQVRSSDPDAP